MCLSNPSAVGERDRDHWDFLDASLVPGLEKKFYLKGTEQRGKEWVAGHVPPPPKHQHFQTVSLGLGL